MKLKNVKKHQGNQANMLKRRRSGRKKEESAEIEARDESARFTHTRPPYWPSGLTEMPIGAESAQVGRTRPADAAVFYFYVFIPFLRVFWVIFALDFYILDSRYK